MTNPPETSTAISAPQPQKCFCYSRDEILALLNVQSPLTLDFSYFPGVRRTTAMLLDVTSARDIENAYTTGPVMVRWEGPAHRSVLAPELTDCSSHGVRGR